MLARFWVTKLAGGALVGAAPGAEHPVRNVIRAVVAAHWPERISGQRRTLRLLSFLGFRRHPAPDEVAGVGARMVSEVPLVVFLGAPENGGGDHLREQLCAAG